MTDSWDRPPPGSSGALGTDPGGGDAATIAPWQSSFGGERLTPGKNIGPYPIERELGRGGMGVVYLAKDLRLNRRVAIKVLPDVFAQHPERAARFRREAQLLASLNHPNIAAIYGLEEHEGHHYIVMEYVPGDTLTERLANGPLAVEDAVHISAQIAEGLEAAHERGVIHRDLKPGNVKITPDGLVK
ncbi:MAG: serine/threonine protein kinase, partial [Phycisphaeraceae bacterium]|nr:serine/threonine protein kinase [Phycisphaeraceae bacterium]